MREVLSAVASWGGAPTVLATVVTTWGSSPRGVGAKMAFTPDHRISGSVSGGCVEGAVIEAGLEALETGRPRLLRFGVADETAFEAVGLACGGSIEVFVEALAPELRDFWSRAAMDDAAAAAATVVDGDWAGWKAVLSQNEPTRLVGPRGPAPVPAGLAAALGSRARGALAQGGAGRERVIAEGMPDPVDVFAEAMLPAPTVILVGGVHIAVALVPLAKALGFRTIVLDPREAFGNAARFPEVDALVAEWPDKALRRIPITRGTALVALTHDEKFDDPALKIALRSEAFYVGALGGRVTREKRYRRLQSAGLTETELARLHQPIGLDIGARTPEEIALATLAQIVAARNRRA